VPCSVPLVGFEAELVVANQHRLGAENRSGVDLLTGVDQRAADTRLSPELAEVASATDLFPRFLAQAFALAGHPAPAMMWLRHAIDRSFINYPFLARHDPCFGTLRRQAAFRRLLAAVRKRWQAFEE
jgi:hypothetical protein